MNTINFKNYLRLSKKRIQEAEEELKNIYEGLQLKIEFFKKNVKIANFIDKILYKAELKELQELEESAERCQMEIESYNRIISLTSTMISSFDHNQAIKFIEDPALLFMILMLAFDQEKITLNDISEIFGGAMVFNATHLKKGKAPEELKKLMVQVSEYYNLDGTFRPSDNEYDQVMKSMIEYDINCLEIAESVSNKTLSYEDILFSLGLLHEEYMKSIMPVSEPDKADVKPPKDKSRGEKLKELRKYYKNGDLVCIPDNLDDFSKLLEELQIDEKEQRYIYSLINQAILVFKDDFAPEQLEETLPETSTSSNLIFLKDANGINYFDADLDQMEKSYQDMCLKVLDKVNHNFKRNFRRVMADDTKEIRLYEVYYSVAHVIFCPLEEGTYLILGASIWRDDYGKIINRFLNPNNRTYIEEIKEMLNSPEEREKLLNETIYPAAGLLRK